jgi:hypothetical protein
LILPILLLLVPSAIAGVVKIERFAEILAEN